LPGVECVHDFQQNVKLQYVGGPDDLLTESLITLTYVTTKLIWIH